MHLKDLMGDVESIHGFHLLGALQSLLKRFPTLDWMIKARSSWTYVHQAV